MNKEQRKEEREFEYRTDEQGIMNGEVHSVHLSFRTAITLLKKERINRGNTSSVPCSSVRYSL